MKSYNQIDSDTKIGLNVNVIADSDVNRNLEKIENETLQQKWNILEKSHLIESIHTCNYDLNDNIRNDVQLAKNWNTMEMANDVNVNGVNDDNECDGAAALEVLQMTQTNEKSISIKNRTNDNIEAECNEHMTKYKRQTNIINESYRSYSNYQRHHDSHTLYGFVQPMKTQCKTTGECLYIL